MDITHRNPVVKQLLLLVAKMAEPIPLARGLGVERPYVIVHSPRRLGKDLMVKGSPVVETIISDMFYANKQAESQSLAYHMANRTSALVKAGNLGDKHARFYVLRNTLIPAILIEVGFLSNPKEERLLKTQEYRQKLAYGIARSILEYLHHE